ncbi:hypothetical protein FHX42_000379 [Saccharopolyspora lacisalsi]|uniref:Uncharacterized protein n=1 Tax=Halosaccharopolyspora lacisalsi TaxID=1000566 RepID=A0A839DPY8_9PSEU|nr:hypothetical protein [Halosaccharopolyspora lacisalsi]MBA8823050.1 hypothetical protein [Halosaccharopolyspora lacisalsi]
MNTATGTCRVGDDDQDRPCEIALDDGPGQGFWYLDTCVSWEESDELMNRDQPVDVRIHLDEGVLVGRALLNKIRAAPGSEGPDSYPVSAHMIGSGPLREAAR